MSQVARNTSAGALGGGLAGAATGAEIGSFGGPVGSAIGAIAGAVIGGVAGGKKARADYENQQEEVKRVQAREDSAIRRSVIDSQLAGINVASDTPPAGAGASSVAPVQTPETLSDIVKAGDNLASTLMKRTQLEQQQNLSAFELLFKQYDKIQQDSYQNLLDSQKELDDLTYKFRQNYTTENQLQSETDEKLFNSTQRLNEKLHSASFTDEEIKYWRDNFISKSEEKTESKEKTGMSGDFGGALIGALDNFCNVLIRLQKHDHLPKLVKPLAVLLKIKKAKRKEKSKVINVKNVLKVVFLIRVKIQQAIQIVISTKEKAVTRTETKDTLILCRIPKLIRLFRCIKKKH